MHRKQGVCRLLVRNFYTEWLQLKLLVCARKEDGAFLAGHNNFLLHSGQILISPFFAWKKW
jgi:hypothetical protein